MAGADGKAKTSDLGVRTASAAVMLVIAGGALWLGDWWWIAFVAVVAAGTLFEWIGLVHGFVRGPVSRGLWNATGLVYIAVAACVLVAMRMQVFGLDALLLLLGAVVATDVGAYLAGRTFGGPKIAPAISPSKTWAGLLGGMAGAGAVLVAGRGPNPPVDAFIAGAVVAMIAQAGDFFESWMKRRAGVKDSGRLIPGHGGLLDRLDGLLAVAFVIGLVLIAMAAAGLSGGESLLPSPA